MWGLSLEAIMWWLSYERNNYIQGLQGIQGAHASDVLRCWPDCFIIGGPMVGPSISGVPHLGIWKLKFDCSAS